MTLKIFHNQLGHISVNFDPDRTSLEDAVLRALLNRFGVNHVTFVRDIVGTTLGAGGSK